MAHSNRKLQGKGPKQTRNKEMKAKRSGQQAERLRQVLSDQRAREEAQAKSKVVVKSATSVKVKRYSKKGKAQDRRNRVFLTLSAQLDSGTEMSKETVARIKRELIVLKSRLGM